MTRNPLTGEMPQWQQQLLQLVFPDTATAPTIIGNPTVTAVPSDSATVHNIAMPNPVAAGDLLLVLIASHTGVAVTTPSNWTPLATAVNGTTVRVSVFGKSALASDGGTTVNFATSTAANLVAQVLRIAQGSWTGQLADLRSATFVGTSAGTAVDPPSLNTGFGNPAPSELFLILGAYAGTATPTGSNPPANYAHFVQSPSQITATATNSTILSAWRLVASDTDNPLTFNVSANSTWVAATLGLRPTATNQLAKRQAVVSAHFDSQGTFDDLVTLLQQNPTFSPQDLENLRFVFEMYDKVSRYYPIVAAVYPSKAGRGWKTIADLATVSLADWTNFAGASQAFVASSGNTAPPNLFPGDIPGITAADKAAVYGQRLLDLFGGFSPQSRFVAAFTQSPPIPGLQQIAGFLQANPTFSLESSNIDVFNAAALASPPTSPITAPLPASLVPQMKQLQRVYRLTSDFSAASALITNGFDSAVTISQTEEGAFIASQEKFVGGLTAARNIHRTASHYTKEVLFNVVKFHQNINDAGGLMAVQGAADMVRAAGFSPSTTVSPTEGFTANLGGIDNPFSPDPRKLPNWTTLFGNLNSCACQCCQTVLSPGAYLVDILEFASAGPRKPLLDRRPDLEDIEINCSNTNTELPYIDLVNETLEGAIDRPSFPLATNPTGTPVPITVAQLNAGLGGANNPVRQAFIDNGSPLGPRAVIALGIDDNPAGVRVWTVQDDAALYSIRGTAPPFTTYPSLVAPRAFVFTTLSGPAPGPVPATSLDSAAANGSAAFDPLIPQAFQDHGYVLTETATIHVSAEDSVAIRVWVVQDETWQFTIRGAAAPYISIPVPQTSDNNDSLEVFPEHVTTAAYDTLSKAVFPFTLPLALGKEEANIFLQAKGVRQHEILEAFTIDNRDTVLAKGTGALAYLNLSTSEAQAILAAPSGGPKYWGFDTTAVVQIVRPDQPTQTLTGTWLDLLTLVPRLPAPQRACLPGAARPAGHRVRPAGVRRGRVPERPAHRGVGRPDVERARGVRLQRIPDRAPERPDPGTTDPEADQLLHPPLASARLDDARPRHLPHVARRGPPSRPR